jgi:hypothetical protein
MNEKRLSNRVITYWEKLKGDKDQLPEMARFRSSMLEEVWDRCLKVRVDFKDGRPKFEFEHVGDDVTKAMGKKLKDQVSLGVTNVPGGRILNRVSLLLPNIKGPMMDQGELMNEKEQMVKYRSCILPFGNKNGELTHVIVALSWRIYK